MSTSPSSILWTNALVTGQEQQSRWFRFPTKLPASTACSSVNRLRARGPATSNIRVMRIMGRSRHTLNPSSTRPSAGQQPRPARAHRPESQRRQVDRQRRLHSHVSVFAHCLLGDSLSNHARNLRQSTGFQLPWYRMAPLRKGFENSPRASQFSRAVMSSVPQESRRRAPADELLSIVGPRVGTVRPRVPDGTHHHTQVFLPLTHSPLARYPPSTVWV
ncbi:hypothetical protein BCR44DRAFT_1442182, partial [Catenaria anguillulae PL171]